MCLRRAPFLPGAMHSSDYVIAQEKLSPKDNTRRQRRIVTAVLSINRPKLGTTQISIDQSKDKPWYIHMMKFIYSSEVHELKKKQVAEKCIQYHIYKVWT